ncbi:beta-1,4-glucuronyltransferase 1-like [Saccoglossus kowalevskii]|uniref:Beta-1,4-glucuronyltransferase 1 n=1 Tax=Saccoglossus kowalevskii TaxID=10224 RepID=A0ABM0MK89_SACKO|nr:PREDICTED: N-acetyllactosaminide beta-1,3-N-acetylglucosaminyltransferase-like [Saccoglossus kowalevskii]
MSTSLIKYVWRLFRQKCSTSRVIVTLVAAIVVLQIVHLLMLSRVGNTRGSRKMPQKSTDSNRARKATSLPVKLSEVGLDSSGNYQVHTFLVASDLIERGTVMKDDVTIVTQCSPNHLHLLFDQAEIWAGPISVAIFAPNPNITALYVVIAHLRHCSLKIQKFASFHLVYPLRQMSQSRGFNKENYSSRPIEIAMHCTEVKDWIKNFDNLDHENYVLAGDVPYPNNLLRNVAWQGSVTEYILVLDIDIIPSSGLLASFKSFDRRRKSLSLSHLEMEEPPETVYVLPAFEIREGIDRIFTPMKKNELLTLWNEGDVRPFYEEVCSKCQIHSSYTRWRTFESESPDMMNIAYELEWKDPWEPFYIAKRHIPKYDERFKQYGFNRISQVCEVHIAGYNFSVMDTGFVVHKGFKTSAGMQKRFKENDQNLLLFRLFKEELKTKYEESMRRCY